MSNSDIDVRSKHNADKKFIVRPSKPPNKPSISLLILEKGEIIPIIGQGEIVIGRIMGEQTIFPDIDLSPYKAYASGVSRLHAAIKFREKGIYITDLGSTNRTRVNGKRLCPKKGYPLYNGSLVSLGNLMIKVIIE